MLRLIHNQTISGSILINDIDDGLPNKSARRGVARKKISGSPVLVAGGILAPDNYQRDGSSLDVGDKSSQPGVNYPKQKCYIPKWKLLPGGAHSTTIPGYIDVNLSDRVLLSQDHGVIAALASTIAGHATYPLITVATIDPTLTVAPTISSAVVVVSPEALTITGTTFLSVAPDVSSVTIGTTTLSSTAITTAGGTFSATSIVIPASLLTGLITVGTTTVTVNANGKSATALITSAAPTITTAVIVVSTGILTLTGTHFVSLAPDLSTVTVGSTVITAAAIAGAPGGSFADTSIVIPASLLPTVTVGTTTVSVTSDSVASAAVLITSAAPTITSATVAAGGAYTLSLVGTNFLSLAPDVSSVTIGATTLTQTQITTAGGTFNATSIVVPESLVPLSMVVGTTTVTVTADAMTTAAHAIAVTNTAPTIATAVLTTVLTLTGTGFRSILPNLTSVTTTGHVGTMTAANIIGAGGTISDTSIVIPFTTTGYPTGLTTGDTVAVNANSLVTLTPATI
jgi:hypothetical protein